MTDVEYDVNDLYKGGTRTSALKIQITIYRIQISSGPAMEGTDEAAYINIFSLRNFVHLNEVAKLYEATYGTSLSTVVTTEFNNDMGNACVSICTRYDSVL